MDEWLEELIEQYVGRQIRDDAEEIGEIILSKHGAEHNLFADYEISLLLVNRGYYTEAELAEREAEYIAECNEQGEIPGKFHCEEMNWSISCTLNIAVDEGEIIDIHIEDRIYGGNALGDYDPYEIYTDDEWNRIIRASQDYLKAICLPDDNADDENDEW